MMDLFKKAALIGIGMMSLTEDKVSELIKELEKEGEISSKEGEDLLKKVLSKVDEDKKAVEERLRPVFKKYLSRIDIASKEDVLRLEKKVKALEKKINEIVEGFES